MNPKIHNDMTDKLKETSASYMNHITSSDELPRDALLLSQITSYGCRFLHRHREPLKNAIAGYKPPHKIPAEDKPHESSNVRAQDAQTITARVNTGRLQVFLGLFLSPRSRGGKT